ncbi:MAG: MBL fold metallo-hydrolase [Promethearchaeota archaeon]|nr:MAG: MBL fold metallo-hydrolase [Candidatus Lokiarchaeota archaeon]
MEDFVKPLSEEFKNIFFIKGANKARYPYSHSILLGDYLIDTGISHRLLIRLKKLFPIKNIILSHWHEDHISGNSLFKDVKFYCHLQDKPVIEDIEKMVPYYNVENTIAGDELKSFLKTFLMRDIKVDYTIEDNQTIDIGEHLKLKILHTPGHTAGHCAFYEQNSKIAFFGDIDLTKYPYYGNIDASLTEFEKSIERLNNLDIETAITGHREVINGEKRIKEELEKYKSILLEREERILTYFSETKNPIRPTDLKNKNIIYRKYTAFKDFELIAEVLMIEKHFDKFHRNELIITKGNGYILN